MEDKWQTLSDIPPNTVLYTKMTTNTKPKEANAVQHQAVPSKSAASSRSKPAVTSLML